MKCVTKVYHPNIDLEGNVCLNILREDWKPGLDDRQPRVSTLVYQDSFFVSVLTINSIVYGLQYLFLEPNPEDPLNKEAANELQVRRKKPSLSHL